MSKLLLNGRIDHNKAEVILTHIAKEHPAFFVQSLGEVKEKLPEFIFQDYNLIPDFLEEFCLFRGFPTENLIGASLSKKYTEHRKEFLAVLLLCYHPEKLIGITYKRTWQGVEKNASEALQCNIKSLANSIPETVGWFKTYKDFEAVVREAHAIITEKYQGREWSSSKRQYTGFIKNNQLGLFE